jgi:hypothetical protein
MELEHLCRCVGTPEPSGCAVWQVTWAPLAPGTMAQLRVVRFALRRSGHKLTAVCCGSPVQQFDFFLFVLSTVSIVTRL